MRKISGRKQIEEFSAELLEDESNTPGAWCEEAAWPENTEDARSILQDFQRKDMKVTLSGARTGIVAGAIPEGGAVISSSAMKSLSMAEPNLIRVSAGVTMDELNSYISREKPGYFYPPDPTETTASLGGTAATDASGADSYRYGATRKWVDAIEVLLPGGRLMQLKRGEYCFSDDGICSHPMTGKLILPVMTHEIPEKNAAGYWIRPGMDLIDLFIGSEGTLGLICGLKLRLVQKPEYVIDMAIFLPSMNILWVMLNLFRSCELKIRALELMDPACLDFLRNREHPDEVPSPPPDTSCALLVRAEAGNDDEFDSLLEILEGFLETSDISEKNTWFGMELSERKRIQAFRHALPEAVNQVIAARKQQIPELHKLGSDSAVTQKSIRNYYDFISSVLQENNLEFVVFGHIGQSHLHANVLPKTSEELKKAEEIMRNIAARAAELGGTVSAEHGIGHLKTDYLSLMYSTSELDAMRKIRQTIDPDGFFMPAINWP